MRMMPMTLFAFATLAPALLIGAGALLGGLWVVAALLFLTALTASLDEIVRRVTPPVPEAEFPAGDALCVALALAHFLLLVVLVVTLSGDRLSVPEKLPLFTAAGLFFGQVSNSNAHELIHRGSRRLHVFGKWVYISLLFGHHTSAHVLVHHVHVATRADPSTARLGESLYRYMKRAWRGAFIQGYQAEAARLAKTGHSPWANPYVTYVGGAVVMLAAACLLGGLNGLAYYICLAAFAQMQLLMSDYVQHYGLARAQTDTGRHVPVGTAHSWNSPHWFSSALMLNAPRHSSHHAHPARPYAALTLPENGPTLPRALPVMACVALYPKLWRRVMDPRAKAWATPSHPVPNG